MPLDQLIRIVNLSHVNDPGRTPAFPGDPKFVLERAATIATHGYNPQ
jgi:kynurenine formamidase